MASRSAPYSRRVPFVEADRPRRRIDRRDTRSEHELDVPLLVQLRRPHRDPVVLRFAGEIVLREVRTIDRRVLIAADDRDGIRVALTAQHVGCREAGGAAADDDDGRGVLLHGWRRRGCLRKLLAHEHLAVPLLDLPARDRIQRRRAKRFAGLEAEARVMERAPDRLADDEAVGEMAAVVRAARADGKETTAGFDDRHFIVADSAFDRRVVREAAERNAGGQIGKVACL